MPAIWRVFKFMKNHGFLSEMGPYGSIWGHIKTGRSPMARDHFQNPLDPKKGHKNPKSTEELCFFSRVGHHQVTLTGYAQSHATQSVFHSSSTHPGSQPPGMEIWQFGDLGTWKSRNVGSKKQKKWEVSKFKSVLPKMLASSGLVGKSLEGPIWGHPRQFFPWTGKMQKCVLFAYFPWWANGPYSPGVGPCYPPEVGK